MMEQQNLEILVKSWPEMQIKFVEPLDLNTGIIVEIVHYHIYKSGGVGVRDPNTFKTAIRNINELMDFIKRIICKSIE